MIRVLGHGVVGPHVAVTQLRLCPYADLLRHDSVVYMNAVTHYAAVHQHGVQNLDIAANSANEPRVSEAAGQLAVAAGAKLGWRHAQSPVLWWFIHNKAEARVAWESYLHDAPTTERFTDDLSPTTVCSPIAQPDAMTALLPSSTVDGTISLVPALGAPAPQTG